MVDVMKSLIHNHFITDWVIPFYQTKISNWDDKKEKLLQIYDSFSKEYMSSGEQLTDFNGNSTRYHILIQNILFDDIKNAVSELGFKNKIPKIDNAWFQIYEYGHSHSVHNHGMGRLSMVCYIKYNPQKHRPTTFVAPFTCLKDGNVLEWEPKNVDEGTMVVFPSALSHYVPTNQSDDIRMILSANIGE